MPKSLSADIKTDIKSALLAGKDSMDVANRFETDGCVRSDEEIHQNSGGTRPTQDCEENDWRRVVFSDETKVNIWGSDGCKYYWSRPGDPLKPHHIDVTVKHGGGSLIM
ncbi:hypothetical protein G6F59_013311 [Rhizopus arrhizus]|nr:hypothetical protein G6F59_013311 [Rhizopus arrhizus]